MFRRHMVLILGGALALGAAACEKEPASTANGGQKPVGGGGKPARADGLLVREGYFDADLPVRMRLEIKHVERFGQDALLRFWVTNLDAEPALGSSIFGSSRVDTSFGAFELLDPVSRKLYRPLRRESKSGSAFGSHYWGTRLHPRVRYEARVYYPAPPPGVRKVTVLTPGTTAEMPGVPVVDGPQPPAAPSDQPTATPAPGQSATLAVRPPTGTVWRQVDDLYDVVEGREASTASGGGGETITFPSDVLFAFDQATLTGRARQVIAAAATDLKTRADPGEPVSIEGHTDAKGALSHNQPLSERRAKAVQDALQEELGGQAYQFQATGKADTEPVAKEVTSEGKDNPAGRARNRRVEISYTLRPEAATTSPSLTKRGDPAPPASFRGGDGTVVAERAAAVDPASGGERFRLRVYPFYRDGAYVVAVFDLTNVGGRELRRPSGFRGYFRADDFQGGDYGSFRVVNGDGTAYRTVRAGPAPANDNGLIGRYLSGSILLDDPNLNQRTYMYAPAPPSDTTSVTFDAGVFGKIPNVPVT